MTALLHRESLVIGHDRLRPADGGTIEVVAPSNEQVVGTAPCATAADVDTAVATARTALGGDWLAGGLVARVEVVRRAADLLEAQTEDLAELLAWELGSPVADGRRTVSRALGRMQDSFPAAAGAVPEAEVRRDADGPVLLSREPVGVVAALTPWNTAFGGVVLKVVPALLAGCPVVLKPSPLTPLDPYYLVDALEQAGLPAGMLSVLPGGADVGEALVRHPGVDMVTFTGSTDVGRIIARNAAETLKRVVLECGGKSAAVVLPDADVEATVNVVASAGFMMSGQYCRALSRVLVPASRRAELVDALVAAAERIIAGDPFHGATTMGPLVSSSQRQRVEDYVALGRHEGVTVATGGTRPGTLPAGWYFSPTVLTDVRNDMRVAREEIFGPVVTVITYDGGPDEAVRIANDSPYGLSGAVFTTDLHAGVAVASRIESGLVGVNTQGARECVPCSGFKSSGLGDEHGPEGHQEFLRKKAVLLPEEVARDLEAKGVPTVCIHRERETAT